MTLSQIQVAIKDWLVLKLNGLKARIAAAEQTAVQLAATVTTGLASRFTKSESDARYLGIGDTAVDSTKVGGKTLATVELDYTTAIGVAKAEALLAGKANVKRIFGTDIIPGTTVDFADLVNVNGLQSGSSYELKFNGAATATMTVTGLMNHLGASVSKVVSDGDSYIFDVVKDSPDDSVKAVSVGTFFDSTANLRFNAVQAQQEVQDGRLNDIEAKNTEQDARLATAENTLAGLNGDYVTKPELTAAFQGLYDQLVNSGFDPN